MSRYKCTTMLFTILVIFLVGCSSESSSKSTGSLPLDQFVVLSELEYEKNTGLGYINFALLLTSPDEDDGGLFKPAVGAKLGGGDAIVVESGQYSYTFTQEVNGVTGDFITIDPDKETSIKFRRHGETVSEIAVKVSDIIAPSIVGDVALVDRLTPTVNAVIDFGIATPFELPVGTNAMYRAKTSRCYKEGNGYTEPNYLTLLDEFYSYVSRDIQSPIDSTNLNQNISAAFLSAENAPTLRAGNSDFCEVLLSSRFTISEGYMQEQGDGISSLVTFRTEGDSVFKLQVGVSSEPFDIHLSRTAL